MLKKRIGLFVAGFAALAALALIAPLGAFASSPEFSPGTPLSFTLTSGSGTLEASTGERLHCLSDLGHGNITGPRTFLALIIFHGCTAHNALSGEECPGFSPGQPEGLIHIHIIGELGTIKAGNGAGNIGAILEPALGTSFVTLKGSCITEANVTGTAAGEITPVKKVQTTGKLIVTGSAGTSGITEIAVLGKVIDPKLTAFAGLVTASENTTDENTFDGPVEVT
jgi:hypothetical protein